MAPEVVCIILYPLCGRKSVNATGEQGSGIIHPGVLMITIPDLFLPISASADVSSGKVQVEEQ